MPKVLTEKQLRAIDPATLETKEIKWSNGTPIEAYDFTGKVRFNYDIGLSILNKEDTEHCLTSINGPNFKGNTNYEDDIHYRSLLTAAIKQIKTGHYKGKIANRHQWA